MTTYAQATDQLYTMLSTAWSAGSAAIVGYVPVVYWPGQKEPDNIDGSKYWIRVSRRTVSELQTGLATDAGQGRKFTNHGLVTIQLFCPMSSANSFQLGTQLAELLKNALRGHTTSGKVWFKNAHTNELPVRDIFYRFNVVASYQYDDAG